MTQTIPKNGAFWVKNEPIWVKNIPILGKKRIFLQIPCAASDLNLGKKSYLRFLLLFSGQKRVFYPICHDLLIAFQDVKRAKIEKKP